MHVLVGMGMFHMLIVVRRCIRIRQFIVEVNFAGLVMIPLRIIPGQKLYITGTYYTGS